MGKSAGQLRTQRKLLESSDDEVKFRKSRTVRESLTRRAQSQGVPLRSGPSKPKGHHEGVISRCCGGLKSQPGAELLAPFPTESLQEHLH